MSREDLEIIDTTAGNNPEQVDTVLDENDNVIAGVEPVIQQEEQFFSNLAETLDESILSQIGSDLVSNYEDDKRSRQQWVDS